MRELKNQKFFYLNKMNKETIYKICLINFFYLTNFKRIDVKIKERGC